MSAALTSERRKTSEGHLMPENGLFSDQLFTATELSRRCGWILDVTLRRPVTITRNDQHFALLRRELAAQLFALRDQVRECAEALRAIRLVRSNTELPRDHPYRWLKVYDSDDLALMEDELVEVLSAVIQGGDAEAVESVIHEWHESAIAAESGVLNEALEAESGPVPLTSPCSDRESIDA
jgi:hypothetical protein